MNVPGGVLSCKPPQVPMRTTSSCRNCSFSSRVLKSILASASTSFITMSMLSHPIPVDITVMRLPLYVPVMVWNSRLSTLHSLESKCEATSSTRPGSPTSITLSARCSGLTCKWNTDPSPLMISSDSAKCFFAIIDCSFSLIVVVIICSLR